VFLSIDGTSTMTTSNSTKKAPPKVAGGKVIVIGRNSSAGAFTRLSDPAIRPAVEKLKKELSKDPEAARRFMEDVGYLTPKGKVAARYA
jgi:hypothetical protein